MFTSLFFRQVDIWRVNFLYFGKWRGHQYISKNGGVINIFQKMEGSLLYFGKWRDHYYISENGGDHYYISENGGITTIFREN